MELRPPWRFSPETFGPFPQALVEGGAKRVVNLASQWEKRRAPLIDEYRRLKELCSNKDVSCLQKVTCPRSAPIVDAPRLLTAGVEQEALRDQVSARKNPLFHRGGEEEGGHVQTAGNIWIHLPPHPNMIFMQLNTSDTTFLLTCLCTCTELWVMNVSFPSQVTELESLPKDVSRSAYTQRILEIVGNIKKQKEEITKVHSYILYSLTLRRSLLIFIFIYLFFMLSIKTTIPVET